MSPPTGDNAFLKQALDRLDWSCESFARRINAYLPGNRQINQTTPYGWRDRGRLPRDPRVARAACEVLTNALGSSVSLDDLGWGGLRRRAGQDREAQQPALDGPWTVGNALGALTSLLYVQLTRNVELPSGDPLLNAVLPWMEKADTPPPARGPARVPDLLTHDLVQATCADIRLAERLGGGAMHKTVRERLRMTVQLLATGSYEDETGRTLFAVAAELARLTGWCLHDRGEALQAQRHYLAALRAAHVAGDRVLGADVLGSLSSTMFFSAHRFDAMQLDGIGSEGAAGVLPPQTRAAQRARLARFHGSVGNAEGLRAASEHAYALIARPLPDPAPVWGVRYDTEYVDGLVGHAHMLLGDFPAAERLLARGVANSRPERLRDRALMLCRLADCRLELDRPDEARQCADEAYALVDCGLDSPRVMDALRGFDVRWVERYPGHGAARTA
jgi:hypothetical protein